MNRRLNCGWERAASNLRGRARRHVARAIEEYDRALERDDDGVRWRRARGRLKIAVDEAELVRRATEILKGLK